MLVEKTSERRVPGHKGRDDSERSSSAKATEKKRKSANNFVSIVSAQVGKQAYTPVLVVPT